MTQLIEKSTDGQHFLVKWTHTEGNVEYVVCSYYDSTKPVGCQWQWGHYFQKLTDAIKYWCDEGYNDITHGSDTVYLDDITGCIGVWLDSDMDPAIPLEAIQALEKAYNICVKAMEE